MDIHNFLSQDPPIKVTPWSKQPTHAYEPVEFDMYAIVDMQETMILLSRKNGFSMAINLSTEGVDLLLKELQIIQREFKAERARNVSKLRGH